MNLSPPFPRPSWGDGGVTDHWSTYLHGSPWPKKASPFHIPTRELAKRAEFDLMWREIDGDIPFPPRTYVTDFSKWIFDLYEPMPRSDQLVAGQRVEAAVDTLSLRRSLSIYLAGGWELLYRDPLDKSIAPLKISSLQIAGLPLWGRPDIVFREISTGAVIIVERKASQRPMPSDSWPNARAQLWCYSKADIFANAPKITLVAEAWRENKTGAVYPNGVVTWNCDDSVLSEDMNAMFKIYRRQFQT